MTMTTKTETATSSARRKRTLPIPRNTAFVRSLLEDPFDLREASRGGES